MAGYFLDRRRRAHLPMLEPVGHRVDARKKVLPDSYLTLHYRVALAANGSGGDVEVRDIVSTFEGKPATLQLGAGQLAPALEARLVGLAEGDHAVFELEAGVAFGMRNRELIRRVSGALLDAESGEDAHYCAGDVVEFNAPGGARYAGIFMERDDTHALFDFNHPLAGQPVRFEAEIIGVL